MPIYSLSTSSTYTLSSPYVLELQDANSEPAHTLQNAGEIILQKSSQNLYTLWCPKKSQTRVLRTEGSLVCEREGGTSSNGRYLGGWLLIIKISLCSNHNTKSIFYFLTADAPRLAKFFLWGYQQTMTHRIAKQCEFFLPLHIHSHYTRWAEKEDFTLQHSLYSHH